MTQVPRPKPRDLQDRTLAFAAGVRAFVRVLPRTLANVEDARQAIRSSGSVGANHIEANEGISKKDFVLRLRIARKEAKECRYWLRLLDVRGKGDLEIQRQDLVQECAELLAIPSAIINKCQ